VDPTTVQAAATPAANPVTARVTATPAPADPAVSVTAPSTPVNQVTAATPGNTTTVIQDASSGGFLDSIHVSPVIAEVILFFILTGIFFALFRTGVLGINVRETRPVLVLSALFGLGTSLILTCLLSGSTAAGTTYALVYMAAGTLLAAYLWREGIMTRKIVTGVALLSALTGFVFLAPIMPLEIGGIVNVLTGVSALSAGIVVIGAVILLALVVGRVFCGNICPVGSLQELAYAVPVKKLVIRRTDILEIIRLAIFLVTMIAAVYLIDLMAVTGLYDLFSLTVSAGLIVAAGLVLLSMFMYRPVCRIICPFGVLFSLCAEFGLFRLERTGDCIACGKCERVCPTRTAGLYDPKRECYLCARCKDACPVKTAIVYCR
jgi:NAD-dependent dihydropyrimidine dehydrogenase PreA subunit